MPRINRLEAKAMNSKPMTAKMTQRIMELCDVWEAKPGPRDYSDFKNSVVAEFSDITPALLAEVRRLIELRSERNAAHFKRLAKLLVLARRLSGKSDMEMQPALAYLAERGHVEASAILHAAAMPPGYLEDSSDILAAAVLHSDWEVEGDLIKCTNQKTTENTPDKLLAWFRPSH
jgi:hypothetical protein